MPQFWAGFVDDKVDTSEVDTGWGGFGERKTRMPMLFTSYGEARHRYEDVRKVEVHIVGRKRARRAYTLERDDGRI